MTTQILECKRSQSQSHHAYPETSALASHLCHIAFKISILMYHIYPGTSPSYRGVNPRELGVVTPRFLAEGSWGRKGGREILLYLIMYRKYVRKW